MKLGITLFRDSNNNNNAKAGKKQAYCYPAEYDKNKIVWY